MLEIFRTYKFRILSVRIIRFFSTLYVTIFILDSSSQRQDNGFLMYVGKAFFFLSFFLTFFRSFFLSFLLSLFLSFFRSFYYKIFQILFSIKRFKIICDYTRVSLHNRLCLLTQLWLKVSFVGLFWQCYRKVNSYWAEITFFCPIWNPTSSPSWHSLSLATAFAMATTASRLGWVHNRGSNPSSKSICGTWELFPAQGLNIKRSVME